MFLETPRFIVCPKFGYTSEPDFAVNIVEVSSGDEYRKLLWSQSLRTVTVTVGPGPELIDEVQEVIEFWEVLGGRAIGFRCKDYADFKSCRVHLTPTALDQPLIETVGVSPAGHQLIKRYTKGALSRDRYITKPVSPILLADNGTVKTEGSDYTVDYTSGVVDLAFSPVGPLTWGGEFDIPVRFDSKLPVEILEARHQTVSFLLKELRYEES